MPNNDIHTTKKICFNIVRFKSIFKNWGRQISGGIFEIKFNFLKAVT